MSAARSTGARRVALRALGSALLAAPIACGPASPPDAPRLAATSATASVARPRADCALPADGHITSTVVLGERCAITVPNTLVIEGRLEIGAGTTLRFPGCAGVRVARGGSLAARGIDAARVTFAAADPPCSDGSPQGGFIELADLGDPSIVEARGVALDLQLAHVDLVGASRPGAPRVSVQRPAALSIEHSRLGDHGLSVSATSGRVRLRRVHDNELGLVEVPAPLVSSIGASNVCGARGALDDTFIPQLVVDEGTLNGANEWAPRAYVIAGNLSVPQEASLKLLPETRLLFAEDVRMEIAGHLDAERTSLAARRWEAPWQRLVIVGSVDLRDVTIRDTSDPQGAIWMYGRDVALTRVRFESIAGPAIWPALSNDDLCRELAAPARGNSVKGQPFCAAETPTLRAPKAKPRPPKSILESPF